MGAKQSTKTTGDTLEAVVCQDSDIKENEMKVFEIGKQGDQVLLVKQNGKVYAIGNKCTHYGAPLVNGALGKGRVRCPWHGACFNIATGDIEDFPGLDSIPRYNCAIITGGGIKVTASKALLKANKRDKISSMSSRDSKVSTTFVVVGGGAAGNNCAETLRREGFQGRVIMVCGENYLPYDRIKLSKVLNSDYETIKLRSHDFYKSADIDVLLNTKAVKIKTDQKLLLLSDGSQINYNKIFIATGARGRTIKYPGSALENIFTLRAINDGADIYKQFGKNKNLVVLGSSFIGMEVASFAVDKVKSVTVVSRSDVPFDTTLGNEIGGRIRELFESKGVNFVMNQVVERYEGNNDKVSEVVLKNGTSLPADIVVVGLGIDLNTDFLAGSEIIMRMDGSIPVDKFLETNVKGVYAGGDIAYAPVFANGDKPDAIGHWQLAHYHGYIAALNMVGKLKPLQTIPFFWSVLFGLSFRYAGYGAGHTEVVTTGDLKGLKFVSYYIRSDVVVAIITCGSDPIAAKFAELLAVNKKLKKSDVTRTKVDWFEQPLYF